MLGFIKRFSRGNKFMDLLATEIGVDPQIYKAALTEMNLNFAAFNAMYEAEASTEPNERRHVARFAQMSLEGAFEGAKRIKQRFPTESSIDDFILSLGRYAEHANSANDDDLPDLGVGETRGEYVGCYLLWFVQKGDTERSYHSVATNLDQLKRDYVEFFQQIVDQKKRILEQLPERWPASETRRTQNGGIEIPTSDLIRNGHEHDLKIADNCMRNVFFVEKHLDGNTDNKPFIEIGGMEIWIGTGVRDRQKIRGEYID